MPLGVPPLAAQGALASGARSTDGPWQRSNETGSVDHGSTGTRPQDANVARGADPAVLGQKTDSAIASIIPARSSGAPWSSAGACSPRLGSGGRVPRIAAKRRPSSNNSRLRWRVNSANANPTPLARAYFRPLTKLIATSTSSAPPLSPTLRRTSSRTASLWSSGSAM